MKNVKSYIKASINLTNLNTILKRSRCCIIGISNDLHFTQLLDPRVSGRLGQEDLIFHPYGASEITDILTERAKTGLREDVLEQGVVQLCAALAAQEHGDARRALDLLRISVQYACMLEFCHCTCDLTPACVAWHSGLVFRPKIASIWI